MPEHRRPHRLDVSVKRSNGARILRGQHAGHYLGFDCLDGCIAGRAFVFAGFIELLAQVALAAAGRFRLRAVFTKILGDVALVELKEAKYCNLRRALHEQAQAKENCSQPLHAAKVVRMQVAGRDARKNERILFQYRHEGFAPAYAGNNLYVAASGTCVG